MDKEAVVTRKKERSIIYCLTLVLAFTFYLSTSCQKSPKREGKKEVQTQEKEIMQPQPLETKSDKQSIKKEPLPTQTEDTNKKEPIVLTEEEKEKFRKFEGVFGQEGMDEKEALQDAWILLKGSPATIPYYQDSVYGDEKGRLEKYSDDFCTVVRRLASLKSKEGYNLTLKVIKEKITPRSIRPSSRACAAEAIGWYGELKGGKWYGDKRSIPVLKEILKDADPEVRLQAAGSLLSLGEGSIALPVLDELAKAGIHQSTFALDKLFAPEEMEIDGRIGIFISHAKLWDERGKEILIKALSYPSDEVKAFAAVRLAEMKVDTEEVEKTSFQIVEKFKNTTIKDYGFDPQKGVPAVGPRADLFYSNGRACTYAIHALRDINSRKAIPLLNYIKQNNRDWWFVCGARDAAEALDTIGRKGERSK
jgi:hypothetical protein